MTHARKSVFWKFLPAHCILVGLTEMDAVQDAQAK